LKQSLKFDRGTIAFVATLWQNSTYVRFQGDDMKDSHEFRDPIHGFIHVNDVELRVIDTPPVQRLREIHQLALTSYIYPGATHRRFEHSLGVMHLAGRIFDTVTNERRVTDQIRDTLRPLFSDSSRGYWRSIVRLAALCHDVGHAPFSHAAEELFAKDENGRQISHEQITRNVILSQEMDAFWQRLDPPLKGQDIADVATRNLADPDSTRQLVKDILNSIVAGNVFGADRIDYLLRDSYHAGVSYGRFDYERMLETLRIVAPERHDPESQYWLSIGIEDGGIRTAEGLLLARYFMFDQVYLHRKRRILDWHLKMYLKTFLTERYGTGRFSAQPGEHLKLSDIEVMAAMRSAVDSSDSPGHDHARRIVQRDTYKWVWSPDPKELEGNPNLGEVMKSGLVEALGAEDHVFWDRYPPSGFPKDFQVLTRDNRTVSAFEMSSLLSALPSTSFEAIFVHPDQIAPAKRWLADNRWRMQQQVPVETREE
jgi:uncharacterized protein